MDRALISRGLSISEITPLDRLSFVERSGMGALTYRPTNHSKPEISIKLELDTIALELSNIFRIKNAKIIIDQIKSATGNWRQYAKAAGVSKTSSQLIEATIKSIHD